MDEAQYVQRDRGREDGSEQNSERSDAGSRANKERRNEVDSGDASRALAGQAVKEELESAKAAGG
jgi:hypothetical protein